MRFYATNAGRPADEKDDCTVRALAVVTGLRYREAHAQVSEWGRVPGRPFNVTHCLTSKRIAGQRFLKRATFFNRLPYFINEFNKGFCARAITLAEFIKRNPVGKFYLCTRDHAFALVDGVVHDLRPGLVSEDSELDSAWRVC